MKPLLAFIFTLFCGQEKCFVVRRLSRGLVRHPRHHLLNNELALGPWPLRHDFIDFTMKCRSSSTGSLWLWQALCFMMLARHTSTLFISGFRLTTMRLSRRFLVGQGMAAPVFGRMGISRSRGPLREEPGVDDRMESLASTQQRRVRSCRCSRHRAPRRRRALPQAHRTGARSRGARGLGHGRGDRRRGRRAHARRAA